MKELNRNELENVAGGNIFDWLFGKKKPQRGLGGGSIGSW
ncbi:Uncharacterised protein [Neisseria dentiae]|nr:Uncharacterised protein [Neisseria dentiae]